MKSGIIGSGMVARFHAQAIDAMADRTLHAVCQSSRNNGERISL